MTQNLILSEVVPYASVLSSASYMPKLLGKVLYYKYSF